MNIDYQKWYSPHLCREMELKVYGHAGQPLILFPTQSGRFYQAEDEKIIEAVSSFIHEGRITIIAVDSVDAVAWSDQSAHPHHRGQVHARYEQYILHEVAPFIRSRFGWLDAKLGCTGFSMGAYHAANFFFKHPWLFDTVIAISGFYHLHLMVGDYKDDQVYVNSPLLFLPNLDDPSILEQYRKSKIVICSGRGAWEEEMLEETLALKAILEQKKIPAWVDIWGEDVNHDWPWWRKMLPYFIEKLEI